MNNYQWIIVFLNSVFGWLIVHLLFQYLMKSLSKNEKAIKLIVLREMKKEIDASEIVKNRLREVDLPSEIGPFLDGHLDQMIIKIASQIPMGEFLLTGALGQKIKLKVHQEVNQILPEMKEHLIQRLDEKLNIEKALEEKIHNYDSVFLINLIKKSTQKRINQIKWLLALLGAFLGFIELFLLSRI